MTNTNNLKLIPLRSNLRKNSKMIIRQLIDAYVIRENGKEKLKKIDVCIFCGTNQNLSKEHVVPRWLFEGNTTKKFVTNLNGLPQAYIKTTIPTCAKCNNDILNSLEKRVSNLLTYDNVDKKKLSFEDISNIVRWFEIIDYKFQILNISRKFLTSKENGYIPYLADFPISMLRLNKDYTPAKVVAEIRYSQKRLTIKNKDSQTNSLIIFKTSNPDFHFFHTMNEFIFIELPQRKIALFYFFTKQFKTGAAAYKEAMKIIKLAY